MQASVVIVNPGGTGMPRPTISASPAPLPPSTARPPAGGSSKSKTSLVLVLDTLARDVMIRAPPEQVVRRASTAAGRDTSATARGLAAGLYLPSGGGSAACRPPRLGSAHRGA